MRNTPSIILLVALSIAPLSLFPEPAVAAPIEDLEARAACGAPVEVFRTGLLDEAILRDQDRDAAQAFLSGLRLSQAVLDADRAQGVFQLDFLTFSRRLISADRLANARTNADANAAIFARAEAEYGVPPEVLLAFWAFETDFGSFQGDINTANALFTLAHDCRRPTLFRPQIFAAIELYARGDFDPATMTGAWAGEIGQVQMLPHDILTLGQDGDGDGHVDLKGSAADALLSGAALLAALGWRADEPWMQEIRLPEGIDLSLTGLGTTRPLSEWSAMGVEGLNDALPQADLPTSILLPMGRDGPAFATFPNFTVYFDWNQSLTYVTTAAYFATRIGGAPVYAAGDPDPGLDGAQMIVLQERLTELGHDVGGIDGILGARTRDAVQAEQLRLGLPADAWPTQDLLDLL